MAVIGTCGRSFGRTADLNGDGVVNFADVAIVASYWLNECNCTGKVCGDDGCGGSCGICGRGYECRRYRCVPYCDYSGFPTRSFERARYLPEGERLLYLVDSVPNDPYDSLTIDIRQNLGGPNSPGTYLIPDEAYETSNLRVLLEYDCYMDICDKTFLANDGTLAIEVLQTGGLGFGGRFKGLLENVDLVEAKIVMDDWGHITYVPIPNGKVWCLNAYEFDVPVQYVAP